MADRSRLRHARHAPALDKEIDSLAGERARFAVADVEALKRRVKFAPDEGEVPGLPAVRECDLAGIFEVPAATRAIVDVEEG